MRTGWKTSSKSQDLGSAEPHRASVSSLRSFLSVLRFCTNLLLPERCSTCWLQKGGRRFGRGTSKHPDAHRCRRCRQPGAFAGKRVQLLRPHQRVQSGVGVQGIGVLFLAQALPDCDMNSPPSSVSLSPKWGKI